MRMLKPSSMRHHRWLVLSVHYYFYRATTTGAAAWIPTRTESRSRSHLISTTRCYTTQQQHYPKKDSGGWRMDIVENKQNGSLDVGSDGSKTPSPPKDDNNSKNDVMYQVCTKCHGLGKRQKPLSRKTRMRYKRSLSGQDKEGGDGDTAPTAPPPRFEPCSVCNGSGLVTLSKQKEEQQQPQQYQYNNDLPHIAIVGGGIAGFSLAIACQHRGIPHTVLERDAHFSQRRQGYGLTLQQASKALKFFGNTNKILEDGITSTRHVVHKTDGTVVGEWGLRKWGRSATGKQPKRQNVHIARQALRYQLWQAADHSRIQWNARLVEYEVRPDKGDVVLTIQKGNEGDESTTETVTANLLVGSDGIRSQVRKQLIGEDTTPLRYLDCLVVLGICPLSILESSAREHELLDGATVFQTADGNTRIYMMPFSSTEYMWQLSFPMDEQEASRISEQGASALKDEAIKRCGAWHCPVSEILKATPKELVSGYPVYDRALLKEEQLMSSSLVTLMGDACHPMSPFKGQGANQAMLDALSLANSIYGHCAVQAKNKDVADAVQEFEREMLARSAVKVQASAEAAKFLHSDVAIQEGNVTRGAANKATVTAEHTSKS